MNRLISKKGKLSQPDTPYYQYKVDEPRFETTDDYRITIKGWILPSHGIEVKSVRIKNNKKFIEIKYGTERRDILQAFPDRNMNETLFSGFESDIEFEDGHLELQVDFGSGFIQLQEIKLKYTGDKLLMSDYNPHLATNWVQHTNLLRDKSAYYYETERSMAIKMTANSPKLIAFYLPQFHPIPENDRTWGKGFTEWTNVASAEPRFIGHRQPNYPGSLGYYDLRVEDTIEEQINLAKKHGLYGFCFYYYWFSGAKLLEKPLNSFLKHKEWDFNFMICWANENWTKRWDGHDNDVIIAQKYLESDPLEFIKEVEHIILDPRYIKIDNKPILSVYRPEKLDNPQRYVKTWREYFKKKHNLELHLVSVMGFTDDSPIDIGFDAAIDFPPLSMDFKSEVFNQNKVPQLSKKHQLIDPKFEGSVYDYRAIVLNDTFHTFEHPFPTYKGVMPSWDNDARKKGKGSSFYNVTPDLYAEWLEKAIANRKNKDEPVFINAWNEWAEGAMLEPTAHFGNAVLNRTSEVVAAHTSTYQRKENPPFAIRRAKDVIVAVVIHLYYIDQWEYIKEKLNLMGGVGFDLFINIQHKDKNFSQTILKDFKGATITILPNRGRDILPFLYTATRIDKAGYEVILKIHTKKSLHRKDGEKWFKDMLDKVIPSSKAVREIINITRSEKAFVGPRGHLVSLETYIGSNLEKVQSLSDSMGINLNTEGLSSKSYFGGSIFWVSTDYIRPLLNLHLMPEDFEAEQGQIDGTMAHAVERIIGLLSNEDFSNFYKSSRTNISKVRPNDIQSDYRYAK